MRSFFLQRLNLIPKFYIIILNTQFPQNFWQLARKSAETFSLQKILSPRKLDKKASILFTLLMHENQYLFQKECDGSTIILLKRIEGYTWGWGSLIMEVRWSPIYYNIEGNYFKVLCYLQFLKNKICSNCTESLLIVS